MRAERNTVQRQIVLDVVKNLGNHPSFDEVFTRINGEHPSISKSTVYRNLRFLVESGKLRRVAMPDETDRYDYNNSKHYHFKCRTCEKIHDVGINYMDEINELVQRAHGFEVGEHEILFTGLCETCK